MSIATIRAAILEALKPLRTSHKVQTIAAYSGDIDTGDDLSKMQVKVKAPAVLVAYYGAADPKYFEEGKDTIPHRFGLFIIVKDRTSATSRETAATDIIDALYPIFHYKTLGLSLNEQIRLGKADIIVSAPGIAIYAITVNVNETHII